MGRTILYIHPSDELYGSDRCLLDIVRGLGPDDCAVVVLPVDLPYQGALSRDLEAAGAVVERVDMLVLRRASLRPANLPELLRRFVVGTARIAGLVRHYDATLVHSNTVAVICGASAAVLTGRPHVWHVHEHIGDEPRAFKVLIRLLLGAFPGRIIANSRSVARALVSGSLRRLAKTRLVENSVDPAIKPVDRSGRSPHSPVVVGVVGRLSQRKGTAEAIEAAAILANRSLSFQMRFVGDVTPGQDALREAYREQVTALGLQGYVTFVGQVDDIRPQLDGFDMLLLPSQRPEPFGLVVLEAMAAGLPVVATLNGGGSDDILDHGRTGIYCGRDPAGIADAVECLIDDPDLRHQLGRAAVCITSKRYSQARYRAGIMRVYDSLAGPESEPVLDSPGPVDGTEGSI